LTQALAGDFGPMSTVMKAIASEVGLITSPGDDASEPRRWRVVGE